MDKPKIFEGKTLRQIFADIDRFGLQPRHTGTQCNECGDDQWDMYEWAFQAKTRNFWRWDLLAAPKWLIQQNSYTVESYSINTLKMERLQPHPPAINPLYC